MTSRRQLVVVDCETTGLDWTKHVPVEVGSWNIGTGERGLFIPPHNRLDMLQADPDALRINRYYERGLNDQARWDNDCSGMRRLHAVLAGSSVVGSNPNFDVSMMAPMFRRHGFTPAPWHYVPLDIGTYAAGVLGLPIGDRFTLPGLCDRLGVPRGDHTAEGDVTATGLCLYALDEYRAGKFGGVG